jgi:hypothetical protein
MADRTSAPSRAASGWVMFAALMLMFAGAWKILDAFWAFKYDDEVGDQLQSILFEGDLSAYGWIWLLIGIVLLVAGFAVLREAEWARWVGIVAASVHALAALTWIYFQPFWALMSVALSVLVIYGLTLYGSRSSYA